MKASAKPKLIRTSTIAMSLDFLLKGQLAFLNKEYDVVAVSGQDKHLEKVGQREEVRTVAVTIQRNISPLQDLLSLWNLFWLFKKEKPQMAHSITPKAGLLTMIAAKYAGVPVRVHTFTGLIFPTKTGFLQKVLIFMDKVLCYHATHIYPEGQGVKNDLIRYNITDKPLKVIANGNVNGIDTHFFSKEQVSLHEQEALKRVLGINESDFVFLFVGRLVGDKGINELVSTFSNIKHQTLKLLLVGPLETELDPLLIKTLEEIENNKNIISVGFQSDIRPYLAISHCLVFPSYREGFPNVVLQAGAMGLPSIVTNINGSNEIIINGQNGVIVPVKNTNALQEAMLKMMCDLDFYSELQSNARALIVSRYEQKVVWEALLEEYKNISE